MSLPISSTDNPEEIEIDRLLRELGIELPVVESVAGYTLAADDNGEIPLVADDAGDLHDEVDGVICWLPQPLVRMTPWPPEMES